MKSLERQALQTRLIALITQAAQSGYATAHTDELLRVRSKRSLWLNEGCGCFTMVVSLLKRRRLHMTATLSFSLDYGDAPRGRNFSSAADMESELHDLIPPEISLFGPNHNDSIGYIRAGERIAASLFPGQGAECYYQERRDSQFGDYPRFVWLVKET